MKKLDTKNHDMIHDLVETALGIAKDLAKGGTARSLRDLWGELSSAKCELDGILSGARFADTVRAAK
jgi:hypothetical protein